MSERLLRDSTGVRGVLAVNSCTAALGMAMDIAGIGPGDQVNLERMATLAL
jgi:dTDP-4-amino-4,6-dideoxygalactose transaminase